MEPCTDNLAINFRPPHLSDGDKIYQLIAAAPPLDLNSSYLYFLQSSHFAQTCVVAEKDGQLLGFVSGYLRPDKPTELFVWQLAVVEAGRGQGIAKRLLQQQLLQALKQQPKLQSISATISPGNHASQSVFKRFAQAYGLTIGIQPFLSTAHFAGQDHDPEDEYRLAFANGNPLTTLLSAISPLKQTTPLSQI
ncbi:L-2,4-diaminobutyric acid acetyltransferase [Thiosulfatimonas sediminis]|uniref:L-2,4-diaminobutyric acid acetyltransferase n=1 Tax=Thiosulfatimonas sediminis TaxID=2675054 RepID=A0A6F8PSQ4_9GAMM|nr:diaminobutyrate acetyltransferase [Thiosulfatimonas sediminis]BBP45163.1 L-2,4-diaminobutyric acid acetyltransferase [Thiosulfatimonas sediminis]